MNDKKAVMALSGGLDSATLLTWLLDNGFSVDCVAFKYGSKHNPYENAAAIDIAGKYGVPLELMDISGMMGGFKSNLLKTGGDIPEGHYTDASMSKTVVPARNIIFLSILAGLAWSRSAGKIAIGIHLGDHAIYEDCRKEFHKAMDSAIYLGTGNRVEIIAPFLDLDKIGIVGYGLAHKTPYYLTRTCYKDQPLSCGRCGSCNERLEAFFLNGKTDPIDYDGGI